jgi:hypothetical protein
VPEFCHPSSPAWITPALVPGNVGALACLQPLHRMVSVSLPFDSCTYSALRCFLQQLQLQNDGMEAFGNAGCRMGDMHVPETLSMVAHVLQHAACSPHAGANAALDPTCMLRMQPWRR